MAVRLRKTLIDYLVVAISPALIMLLVGSLCFFLIQVFYQGNFLVRLQYIFALFVMASVLIGRISIEEGREHAILFAIPLAIVTLLAINQFVQFKGGLESISSIINFCLLALIWWSADKLTWDCTLIDEQEDDSGEGLLEAAGLDRSQKAAFQEEVASMQPQAVATAPGQQRKQTWWERFVEHRRRPHTPGVWVVYYSLAALPLFGIGQLFIAPDNLFDRRYAFLLLCVYTASALGLLLTTSFLGLRRYMRQRRQEMPFLMVNFWLILGALLIAGVMLATMLLPRPNAEYVLSEPPFRIGSPDQKSSSYAQGRDGVEDKQPKTIDTQNKGKQLSSSSSDKPAEGKSDDKNGKQSRDQKPIERGNGRRQVDNQQPNNAPKTPDVSRPIRMPDLNWMVNLIKWIFYGALALITIIGIWKNRHELWAALLNFGQWLRNLFGGVVFRGAAEADEEQTNVAALRKFTDFIDPFATGVAGRYTPEELVRYSFEALEAWARDHGYPRQPKQTPHEFARGLAAHVSSLADPSIRLAELYCQVAYASGTPATANVGCLSQLWREMYAEQFVTTT